MSTSSELVALARLRKMFRNGEAQRIRRATGTGREQAARAIGVHVNTLTRWERGERTPRTEAALRYLRLLDSLAPLAHEKVDA